MASSNFGELQRHAMSSLWGYPVSDLEQQILDVTQKFRGITAKSSLPSPLAQIRTFDISIEKMGHLNSFSSFLFAIFLGAPDLMKGLLEPGPKDSPVTHLYKGDLHKLIADKLLSVLEGKESEVVISQRDIAQILEHLATTSIDLKELFQVAKTEQAAREITERITAACKDIGYVTIKPLEPKQMEEISKLETPQTQRFIRNKVKEKRELAFRPVLNLTNPLAIDPTLSLHEEFRQRIATVREKMFAYELEISALKSMAEKKLSKANPQELQSYEKELKQVSSKWNGLFFECQELLEDEKESVTRKALELTGKDETSIQRKSRILTVEEELVTKTEEFLTEIEKEVKKELETLLKIAREVKLKRQSTLSELRENIFACKQKLLALQNIVKKTTNEQLLKEWEVCEKELKQTLRKDNKLFCEYLKLLEAELEILARKGQSRLLLLEFQAHEEALNKIVDKYKDVIRQYHKTSEEKLNRLLKLEDKKNIQRIFRILAVEKEIAMETGKALLENQEETDQKIQQTIERKVKLKSQPFSLDYWRACETALEVDLNDERRDYVALVFNHATQEVDTESFLQAHPQLQERKGLPKYLFLFRDSSSKSSSEFFPSRSVKIRDLDYQLTGLTYTREGIEGIQYEGIVMDDNALLRLQNDKAIRDLELLKEFKKEDSNKNQKTDFYINLLRSNLNFCFYKLKTDRK